MSQSFSFSALRAFGLAGLATLTALVAAPAAGATAVTLNATCDFGFIGIRPVTVELNVADSVVDGGDALYTVTSIKPPGIWEVLPGFTLDTELVPSSGPTTSLSTKFPDATKFPKAGPLVPSGVPTGPAQVRFTRLTVNFGGDAPCTLPTPTPSAPIVVTSPVQPPTSFAYDLAGTTKLNTLIAGSLPLKGTFGIDVTQAGNVTGDLVLPPANGRLNLMGFLPVTAKIAFVPVGRLAGTYLDGTLKITTKVRIKVTEAKIFGAVPILAGNNCQAKSLSDLKLTSGAGFSLAGGGSLSGQFAITDLNDCGVLNGLVNPTIAYTGNTITLQATPAASQAK